MNRGRQLVDLCRNASALVLALVLCLSPVGFAWSSATSADSCGKECCRTKKSCCCRKKAGRAPMGTQIAARTCPPGCGQAVAVLTALDAWTGSAPIPWAFEASLGLLQMPVTSGFILILLIFALFGRPPPSASFRLA